MEKLISWIAKNSHNALMPAALADMVNFFILLAKSLSDGELDAQEASQLFLTASTAVQFVILLFVMAVLKLNNMNEKK